VTLGYQDYIDQQDNTAQARINDGIQFEDTVAWFIPNKRGDHDVKFGLQYSYSAAYNTNQGNLNGTFSFGRSNAVFNPAIPSTYPDRLTVRVGGPNVFYQKAHYVSGFAQDKWRLGNITLNLGVRYDLEMLPLSAPDDMFVGEDHPNDGNNIAPRFGVTYDLGGTSVIRVGAGRFFDRRSRRMQRHVVARGTGQADAHPARRRGEPAGVGGQLDAAAQLPAVGVRPHHQSAARPLGDLAHLGGARIAVEDDPARLRVDLAQHDQPCVGVLAVHRGEHRVTPRVRSGRSGREFGPHRGLDLGERVGARVAAHRRDLPAVPRGRLTIPGAAPGTGSRRGCSGCR